VIPQVGLTLLDWMVHYVNLGAYSTLSGLGQALLGENLPPVLLLATAGLMRGGMDLAVITRNLTVHNHYEYA